MTALISHFTEAPEARRYGEFREAVRIASKAAQSLNASDWPRERINQAATGVGAFRAWYNPVVDKFDSLAREVAELLGDPEGRERLREILDEGDQMAEFYAAEMRSNRIPHLPHHMGNRYENVVRAWQVLRGKAREVGE